MKTFEGLTEQEVLALAISLEEEDARIYEDFADGLQASYPEQAKKFREMRQEDLRSRIGYVPQKAVLFSGTIASNIRFGRESATDDEVTHAAVVAQAAEFIDQKPEVTSELVFGCGQHAQW